MSRSRWEWLDFDEDETRQVREFLKQDVEGEGTDPLRVGSSVRNVLSERLFPGTSTQFTRLRYVILTAAVLCEPGSRSVDLRQAQQRLNARLIRANPTETGVIGRVNARRQFVPLYWTAVHTWGLLIHQGDPRNLTPENGRAAFRDGGAADEDGTQVMKAPVRWDPSAARLARRFWEDRRNSGWPRIQCTADEVDYLLDRWTAMPAKSLLPLLAHQVRLGRSEIGSPLLRGTMVDEKRFPEARESVETARAVSLVCWGALLAYNLALLDEARRLEKAKVEGAWAYRDGALDNAQRDVEAQLHRWHAAIAREAGQLQPWADVSSWWRVSPRAPAAFLADCAGALTDGESDLRSAAWKRRVSQRERRANPAPRLGDAAAVATWAGTPEMVWRWDFRWGSAVRRLVEDAGSPRG